AMEPTPHGRQRPGWCCAARRYLSHRARLHHRGLAADRRGGVHSHPAHVDLAPRRRSRYRGADAQRPDFGTCGGCKRRLDPSTHLVASVPKDIPLQRITEIVAREYRGFTVQCPDCQHYTMVSPTQTRVYMVPDSAIYDWYGDQLAKARDILI